jgi:DNA-binding MarR family transcriptional regulator
MTDQPQQPISNKQVIHQLILFAIKHRKIMQRYLEETGVYHAQHRLLMEIAKNPCASQNDIARRMDISPATVAVSLKKLEKGGYILREMDEGDNRLNKITITGKGREVVEESRRIFDMTDRLVLDGFSEEEKRNLFALLQKINANLDKMEQEIQSHGERA